MRSFISIAMLIGSQAWEGWENPEPRSSTVDTHGAPTKPRIDLFRAKLVTGEPIVTPVVTFEEAPEAFAKLFTEPCRCH
jgi:hypothetical protein